METRVEIVKEIILEIDALEKEKDAKLASFQALHEDIVGLEKQIDERRTSLIGIQALSHREGGNVDVEAMVAEFRAEAKSKQILTLNEGAVK